MMKRVDRVSCPECGDREGIEQIAAAPYFTNCKRFVCTGCGQRVLVGEFGLEDSDEVVAEREPMTAGQLAAMLSLYDPACPVMVNGRDDRDETLPGSRVAVLPAGGIQYGPTTDDDAQVVVIEAG